MKKIDFSYLLLAAVLVEMVLGGGGRLTAWGPISLRMFLFTLAIGWSAYRIFRGNRINNEYVWLLVYFLLVTAVALVRGVMAETPFVLWWEDVKPLLYFMMLPFFALVISGPQHINLIEKVVKKSSLILAGAFFIILLLIHSRWIPFLEIYDPLIASGEFFFRGEVTFFYKGFVFLCMGIFFFHLTDDRYKYVFITVLSIALLLTLTRGLYVALLLTYSVYFFLRKKKFYGLLVGAGAIFIVIYGSPAIGYLSRSLDRIQSASTHTTIQLTPIAPSSHPRSHLLGDRLFSDEGRVRQIKDVLNQTTPVSFFIGHGFGRGTIGRPIHMEISYLEIFHKQGILGLSFWGCLILLIILKFMRSSQQACAYLFFLASLFIFFQSLTNQYMNNPIGISVVLISLVALDVQKENRQKEFLKSEFV
jgi:hypothetical protein